MYAPDTLLCSFAFPSGRHLHFHCTDTLRCLSVNRDEWSHQQATIYLQIPNLGRWPQTSQAHIHSSRGGRDERNMDLQMATFFPFFFFLLGGQRKSGPGSAMAPPFQRRDGSSAFAKLISIKPPIRPQPIFLFPAAAELS